MAYCAWLCLALAPLARNATAEANPRHQGLPAEGSPVSAGLWLTMLFASALGSSSAALSADVISLLLGSLLADLFPRQTVRNECPDVLCTEYTAVPGMKWWLPKSSLDEAQGSRSHRYSSSTSTREAT